MRIAFVLYLDRYTRYSAYSVAALLDRLKGVSTFLVESREAVFRVIDYVSSNYTKCVVGLSLLTTRLVDETFRSTAASIVGLAKKRGCVAVAGGPHASGDPLGVLLNLGFDVAVVGEGEPAIEDLVDYFTGGRELSRVRNVVYRDTDGGIRAGPRAEPVELDEYPPFPYWRHLYTPIEITRGCFHGCWYCQVSYTHGFKVRHRSVGNVVEYAKIMVEDGVRDVRFITPDALSYNLTSMNQRVDEDAIEELLGSLSTAVKARGARIFFGSFPSEVRPERVTERVAKTLKKYVSNREIIVGAQSGSDRVLEKIHRGHRVEDVLNAVSILVKEGFKPSVDFIFGLPVETEDDMAESIRLAKRLVEMGARIHLHYYLPLPGTPLFPRPPAKIPERIRAEIMRLVGSGQAYGEFLEQERLSAKIVELVGKGFIRPTTRRPVLETG
ncbi:TIGR04013 family B12-binding domain/radical SAM domain-containing protein [Thermogladius sp.]|uniref:TIGR04013 family B12-binding domain/radical SAM domain-containing protein n=1 Tax=Thermogladius sp. TaxID=2023064 RepID=UPI003D13FB82